MVDLIGACASFNFFLRLFELFWSGPLVQNRPVYASVESLWIDFWSCLRTFPKPAKEDTKELKKGQVQEYKKDKVNFQNRSQPRGFEVNSFAHRNFITSSLTC